MTDTPDDSSGLRLAPEDIREIGRTLYGRDDFRGEMAEPLFVSRAYAAKFANLGCDGVQAAAVLGLIARRIILERAEEDDRRALVEARLSALEALRARLAERIT